MNLPRYKTLRKWRLALYATTFFCTFVVIPAPVQAGPLAALVPTITSIAGGASASAVLGGIASAALSMGLNMLIAKLMAPKEKNIGVKDKLESGGDLPLSIPMGNGVTAGKLIYTNQGGNSLNNMLTMVIGTGQVPITGYSTKVWINNEECNVDLAGTIPEPDAPDGYGFYPITEYDKLDKDKYGHQYCWMKFYDGTQTVADQYLLDTFGADEDKPWTSDMIGRGQAYVIVVCRYSAKGIWSGVPTFKFEFKGMKLYDISKDTSEGGSGSHRWNDKSTWEFTTNPKVMIYNIIRGITYNGKWIYGGQNVQSYQMPADYHIPGISHCDQMIETQDHRMIHRYSACCEIDVDQQPLDVIKELDKCCAGYTMEYGGQWKSYSGPPGAAVLDIVDSDIIITQDQTDDLYRPSQETYNGARATYLAQKYGWVMRDISPYNGPNYQAEDNDLQLIAEMQFPMITEITQVRRLERLAVKDSRRQRTHIIQLPPGAMLLEPWSVLNWTSERNGYVNKKFTVQSIDDLPNCNQLVAIREYDPTDYDYDVTYDPEEGVGILTPVKPGALALDFTVVADQVDKPGSGRDKPAMKIAWTWGLEDIDVRLVRYEVRISASQPKVIKEGHFRNIAEGERIITSAAFRFKRSYQVRMQAVPERTWRETDWTAWKDVTLYDIDIPDRPTLTAGSDLADDGTLDFFMDIDWTAINAEGRYDVRVLKTGAAKAKIFRTSDNTYRVPVTSSKEYTVDVRFVASDPDTVGDWSLTQVLTIPKKGVAPTTPSAFTALGLNKRVRISAVDHPDKDFKRWCIHYGKVNNFADAGTVHDLRSRNNRFSVDGLDDDTDYYFWLTAFDKSGNESAKYPSSNTAGTLAHTKVITDTDVEDAAPNAPGSFSLTALATDIDKDGRLDPIISATWLDSVVDSTHPAAKKYQVQLYRSDVIGTTNSATGYTKVKERGTTDTDLQFEANTRKYYKGRIRARARLSSWTAWSALTSVGVRPSVKANDVATVTGVTATALPNGNKVVWTDLDLDDLRYYKIYAYVGATSTPGSASLVGKRRGNEFIDRTVYSVGDKVWYYVAAVDSSFNEGSKSSGSSAVYRRVQTNDVDDEAISDAKTNQTTPGIPGVPSLSTITADIDGDGTLDTGLTASWSAPGSGVPVRSYNLEIWRSSTIGGTYTLWQEFTPKKPTKTFKANARYFHKGKVSAVSFNGIEGTASSLTTTGVAPAGKTTSVPDPTGGFLSGGPLQIGIFWDPANAESVTPFYDFDHTDVYLSLSAGGPISSSNPSFSTDSSYAIWIPSAYGSNRYFWIRHVDRSGNKSNWVSLGSATADKITPNELATVSAGAVGAYSFLIKTNAGIASPGDIISGSNLVYSDTGLGGSVNPSGTWEAMSRCAQNQATLFIRRS